PLFELALIFNIIDPSDSSTAMHSVVDSLIAGSLDFQVFPPSLLYVIFENASPVLSLPCVGKTNVPSFNVIPCPCAGAHNHHSSFFPISVMFTGSDHVFPSSVLLTIRNCEVCFTPKPG